MSWSLDMRCLYCDGKLPLYRKITHGQFCSTAHGKAYWLEQEKLAVERLHQTHNSLRTYRPPTLPEVILKSTQSALPAEFIPRTESTFEAAPAEATGIVLGGFVAEVLVPRWSDVVSMMAAAPSAFEADRRLDWPALTIPAGPSRDLSPAGLIALSRVLRAKKHLFRPRLMEFTRRETAVSPCWPSLLFEGSLVVPAAKLVKLAWSSYSAAAAAPPRIETLSPLPPSLRRPVLDYQLTPIPAPQTPERLADDEVPFFSRLLALSMFQPRTVRTALFVGTQVPLHVIPSALLLRLALAPVEHVVSFSTRLLTIPRFPLRERQFAPTLAVATPLETLPPALLLRLAVAPVEHVVSVSTRLLTIPRFPLREMRLAPSLAVETPLETVPPALLSRLRIAPVENVVSFSNRLLALPHVQTTEVGIASPLGIGATLDAIPPTQGLQLDFVKDSGPTLAGAGLLALELPLVPSVHSTLVVERRVENLGGNKSGIPSEASQNAISTPTLYPQLKLAEGQRYAVEFQGSRMRPDLPEPSDCLALSMDIALPTAQGTEDFVPESAGLVPLGFRPAVATSKPAAPMVSRLAGIPQPLLAQPLKPSSKLEPLDVKPIADAMQPEPPAVGQGFSGMGMPIPEAAPAPKIPVWAHAAGFWKHAPRDLKLLAFAIPALLALAFHPALPKVAVAASPATGDLTRSITSAVGGHLASVKKVVYDRAAVALNEDFRSGLDDWTSPGDSTTQWSFDATGFVRPGPLALYRPSMGLTDYEMQFLGMIDQKAMSWVIRAADFNNYYVVKLVVLKPGPQTTVGITRYAVIGGKPQDRVDTAVPIDARPDMLYRVLLDVHDDSFALSVQGQMVDSWSDARLRRGGIGFFTARGEESRVRWVQVTHQYDMLGRLCAYLAPYEIPTTNGSW